MKIDRKKELRVGLISIIAIIILVAVLLTGNRISFFNESYDITVEFENAGGLKEGEPVMLRGVILGKVTDIEVTECCVEVSAEISDISLLDSETSAEISMLELTGGRKIDLLPGNSGEPFDPKEPIQGIPPTNITSLIRSLSGLQGEFRNFFLKVDTLVTNLNDLTGDSSVTSDMKHLLAETGETVERINRLVGANSSGISSVVSDLRASSKSIRELTEGNQTDIAELIESLKLMSSNIETFTNETRNLPEDVNAIAGDLKEFSGTLTRDDSALHLLLSDPEFAGKLEATVDKLDSLIKKIDKHGLNANVRFGREP